MYAYPVEELAQAVIREREREARQTRPHTDKPATERQPLRSRLAQLLMAVAVHLDRGAGDSMRPAGRGC